MTVRVKEVIVVPRQIVTGYYGVYEVERNNGDLSILYLGGSYKYEEDAVKNIERHRKEATRHDKNRV